LREKISLNGFWNYALPYGEPSLRRVPGSYHCAGRAEYSKAFNVPELAGRRVLLNFEGIAYSASVFVNGNSAGETMGPYAHYTFDITDWVQTGENTIRADLEDLTAGFGPSEGWENYSGIIRGAYIELVNPAYIQNIFFHQQLNDKLDVSRITVEVTAEGEDLTCRMTLRKSGRVAASAEGGLKLETELDAPVLWSPERPELYELTVELLSSGCVTDTVIETVGFKDFRIKGNRFWLNGAPYFLKGVCRHDMWGEQGFTLSNEQIHKDLTMIKDMGANFIRLVHYPHDRRVVEAADRIGLLVSEEPGLWWSDMSNPEVTGGALEVLRRTILRDRSRVSVAVWLAFNECIFTEQFLADTFTLARALDPYRPVSGANCMNLVMTKELFAKYKWDFYTFHPYGPGVQWVTSGYNAKEHGFNDLIPLDEVIGALSDKPLIFTEWGGWYVHDNPDLFRRFVRKMALYAFERADGLALAGMSYWVWNDMYETNRGGDACVDGILVEGLVDIHRNKRMNYYTLADCFQNFIGLEPEYTGVTQVIAQPKPVGPQTVIDVYAGLDRDQVFRTYKMVLEASRNVKAFFQHKKRRAMKVGPVIPDAIYEIGGLKTRLTPMPPLTACGAGDIAFSADARGEVLYLIGMTVLGEAYPFRGEINYPVAALTLSYADGTQTRMDLRNGREVCTVFMLYGSSRIEPTASEAERALTFTYDPNWESYAANLLKVPLKEGETLKSVTIHSLDEQYPVLLYGATVV